MFSSLTRINIICVFTEPQGYNHVNLNFTMTSLLDSAEHPELDVRVHGLNILRALFRNNKLGESMNQFLERGILCAIRGFKSSIWSVRNRRRLSYFKGHMQ